MSDVDREGHASFLPPSVDSGDPRKKKLEKERKCTRLLAAPRGYWGLDASDGRRGTCPAAWRSAAPRMPTRRPSCRRNHAARAGSRLALGPCTQGCCIKETRSCVRSHRNVCHRRWHPQKPDGAEKSWSMCGVWRGGSPYVGVHVGLCVLRPAAGKAKVAELEDGRMAVCQQRIVQL